MRFIEERLSEDYARQLIERYSSLLGEYNNGRLDQNHINNIEPRNNVFSKVGMIRSDLRK
jgi:hypothetical protein